MSTNIKCTGLGHCLCLLQLPATPDNSGFNMCRLPYFIFSCVKLWPHSSF